MVCYLIKGMHLNLIALMVTFVICTLYVILDYSMSVTPWTILKQQEPVQSG